MQPQDLHIYFAGAGAGIVNVLVGQPFDTVKVNMQANASRFKNMLECASLMLRRDGIRSFYRGATPIIVGQALETGVNYTVYESFLKQQFKQNSQTAFLPQIGISAALAGFCLSIILSPFELVKCRMQVNKSYANPVRCLQNSIKNEGISVIYRGLSGTMAREIPGNMIYFTVYESAKRSFKANIGHQCIKDHKDYRIMDKLSQLSITIFSGGLAGVTMWSLVYPIDTIKTRVQTQYKGKLGDSGFFGQAYMMYKEGGIYTFYRGLGTVLLRAFPANAAQWMAWEYIAGSLGVYEKGT